jgi:hypothetical protein
VDLFDSWEKSYELLPSLLANIQTSTINTKYLIEMTPSIKFSVKKFNRVVWAFCPCIAVWPYLRPILTIDADFLSGRHAGKLFMACAYDVEQQLLPLAFVVVETIIDWNFMWSLVCSLFSQKAGTHSIYWSILAFKITSTYGLIIDVVMIIDEISRCITVRSSDQIQQKSTKTGDGRYVFDKSQLYIMCD